MTFKEYEALKKQGRRAQAQVGGITRGGYVVGDRFLTNGPVGCIHDVPLSEVRDLVIHGEAA